MKYAEHPQIFILSWTHRRFFFCRQSFFPIFFSHFISFDVWYTLVNFTTAKMKPKHKHSLFDVTRTSFAHFVCWTFVGVVNSQIAFFFFQISTKSKTQHYLRCIHRRDWLLLEIITDHFSSYRKTYEHCVRLFVPCCFLLLRPTLFAVFFASPIKEWMLLNTIGYLNSRSLQRLVYHRLAGRKIHRNNNKNNIHNLKPKTAEQKKKFTSIFLIRCAMRHENEKIKYIYIEIYLYIYIYIPVCTRLVSAEYLFSFWFLVGTLFYVWKK